ncbi:MAG: gliding motility-associated C-terminal domain-containing protein [Cryomorphaceae bacterium]|nr:gliding motility-associated C-terminal domain-containing protein [Cryomorphaceae bacterium]
MRTKIFLFTIALIGHFSMAISAQNLTGAERCFSSTGNGYVNIPNFPPTSFPISITFWFHRNNQGGVQAIFSTDNTLGGYHGIHVQYRFNNQIEVSYGTGNCYAPQCRRGWLVDIPNAMHPINTWMHVAIVYSSSTDTDIYIDGLLRPKISTGSGSTTMITGTNPTARIGTYQHSAGGSSFNHFLSQIDELSVWNIALTANQVRDNMCRKTPTPSPGLIAYYKLDEPLPSDSVIDHSGNGRHGVNVGGVTKPISQAQIGDESTHYYGSMALFNLQHTNIFDDTINVDLQGVYYGLQAYTTYGLPNNFGLHANGDSSCSPQRFYGFRAVGNTSAPGGNVDVEIISNPQPTNVLWRPNLTGNFNHPPTTPISGGVSVNYNAQTREILPILGTDNFDSGLPDTLATCTFPDTLFANPMPPKLGAYLWDDLSTGNSRVVSQPGTYYLSGYTICETDTIPFIDSVVVAFDVITWDTTVFICHNDTFTINNIPLTTPGTHTFNLTNPNQCDSTIIVNLDFFPPDVHDTTFVKCEEDSINFLGVYYYNSGNYVISFPDSLNCGLDLVINIVNHPRTTFDTVFEICPEEEVVFLGDTFTSEGTYSMLVASGGLCLDEWLITIDYLVDPIIKNIHVDLCPGEVHIANGMTFRQAGTFTFPIENPNGCDTTVHLTIDRVNDPPFYLTPPEDMPFCRIDGGEIRVVGLSSGQWPRWSTGEQSTSILVFEDGWYWAEFGEYCPIIRDSIFVYGEDCSPRLFIPNAFSPNGTGINERFQIKGQYIKTFEISIFNRWGQQVFHSTDISYSWDGTNNGKLVPNGVYTYVVKATSEMNREVIQETGTVMMIR